LEENNVIVTITIL